MAFPTTSLVASYEPWRWTGYSNNDTINTTTKKFQDDSGNGHHLNDQVTGSPTYLTNILNGLAVVRFSGTTQRVSGNFTSGRNPGTIGALVIPRGLGTRSIFAFNDGSVTNSCEIDIFNDGAGHYTGRMANVIASGFNTTSNTATPVVNQADVAVICYSDTGGTKLRINSAAAGSATNTNLWNGATRFTVGDNGLGTTYWNGDIVALGVYSADLTGTQTLTDLETWLTYLKTTGSSTAYTDTLLPASYTLTGQALKQGYGQTCSPASYTLTGQPVTESTGGGLLGGHGGAQWAPQPGGRR